MSYQVTTTVVKNDNKYGLVNLGSRRVFKGDYKELLTNIYKTYEDFTEAKFKNKKLIEKRIIKNKIRFRFIGINLNGEKYFFEIKAKALN